MSLSWAPSSRGLVWRAAFILNEKRLPKKPPRLNEVVRLVAMLGGFVGRKGTQG
jgi:Transposase Tn5 dimerisation domain